MGGQVPTSLTDGKGVHVRNEIVFAISCVTLIVISMSSGTIFGYVVAFWLLTALLVN